MVDSLVPEFETESNDGEVNPVIPSNTARTKKAEVFTAGDNVNRLPVDAWAFVNNDVGVLPAGIGDRYFEQFKNAGSVDMRVDGSTTEIVFTIPVHATKDIYIDQIRFFGGGSGIQFDQFLSENVKLTNGILVEIKSENVITTLVPIKTTEDFKNYFSFPSGTEFRIDIQAGVDQFLAIFSPDVPFILKSQSVGYTTDDYIKITIRDDLTKNTYKQIEALAEGFRRDP